MRFNYLISCSLSAYKISYRNQLFIISIAWILIQSILFIQTGIKPILESLKYIGAANSLINIGQLPEVRYYFYLTTTLAIAFCLKTGLGYTGVVAIQLLVNFLAVKTFFSSLHKVEKQSLSALISTLVLIFCIPYQVWNFYLYTESIFYSSTLLFFAYCIRYQELNLKCIFVQLFFLILAILSRPLGVLLLPCWIILLISRSKNELRPILLVCFLLSFTILGYISNTVLGNIGDWQVLRPAEKNYIICEMPTGTRNDLSHIKHGSPLHQLTLYLIHYPAEIFALAVKRWQAFFMLTRNYYSNMHNYLLLILNSILYLPLIANCLLIFKKKPSKAAIFFILIIISFAIVVGIQCDDYHNRFHHTIIPLFIFLGIYTFMNNLKNFVNTIF